MKYQILRCGTCGFETVSDGYLSLHIAREHPEHVKDERPADSTGNSPKLTEDSSPKSALNSPKSDSTGDGQKRLKEQLAAIEHERWSDWQKWVHKQTRYCGKCDGHSIPNRAYIDWNKQINTPYDKLSPKEQASDMEQVDRYWPLIERLIAREQEKEAIQYMHLISDIKNGTVSPDFAYHLANERILKRRKEAELEGEGGGADREA